MIVQLLVADGGRLRPLTVHATQVLVCQDNGTPIAVAAEYGTDASQAVSKVGDADFNTTLKALGVPHEVVCDVLDLPKPPPGARLIAGPSSGAIHGR